MSEKHNELLSVVIPTYNRSRLIVRSLDSLIKETYRPIEILVVDDGSTDNTLSTIKSWWQAQHQQDLYFNALSKKNEGAAVARNHGLIRCHGRYIAFLDSDDFVEDGLFQGIISKMHSCNSDIGFGPTQKLDLNTGRRDELCIPSYRSASDLFNRWVGSSEAVEPCSVVWRTEFIRTIGGWDSLITRNQDGEIVARAILKGAAYCISNRGCGVYVDHKASNRISTSNKNLKGLLDVGESLLTQQTDIMSRTEMELAVARYFYIAACRCFASRNYKLGSNALRRSRELGFKGHMGNKLHLLCASTIKLRNYYFLRNQLKSIVHFLKS